MRGMLLLTALPFLFAILLTLQLEPSVGGEERFDDNAPDRQAGTVDGSGPLAGRVRRLDDSAVFRTRSFHAAMGDYSRQSRRERASGARIFEDANNRPFMITATALDWEHHPVNAFMTRDVPFPADSVWVPMQMLAQRLRYQLDERQFRGLEEVWQTTGQSWARLRGDCEDHAILLADWLIDAGYDARVVIGDHRGEGHAWVVLFDGTDSYLLEATDKRNRRKYPLARFQTDYRPQFMFNRTDFWVNDGSSRTTEYQGRQWRKSARFEAL